jgi:hypothetical protein
MTPKKPKKRMKRKTKERMKKTISLARSLKPSGRLNADDIKRAGKERKTMSFSEIKDAKKLGKVAKMASKVASGMGMGMGSEKLKNLLKEAKMRKPSGRINMDDLFNADKYKIKKPKRAPMQKGPLGPFALSEKDHNQVD